MVLLQLTKGIKQIEMLLRPDDEQANEFKKKQLMELAVINGMLNGFVLDTARICLANMSGVTAWLQARGTLQAHGM